MSKILTALNSRQREAVLYNDCPLAIIAGAGSGKTRTITHKIAYLIQEKNVKPYKILAVTFTNKAANEMKKRVLNLINDSISKVNIWTYHSLCARILREDIEHLGLLYSRNFNIIDTIDQRQILKKGYKKFNISYQTISYSSAIYYISKFKNGKINPHELRVLARKDIDKAYANLYQFYLEETMLTNSLDFDDLLLIVNRLFTEKEDIVSKWSNRFDYVLIDEFQDTSKIQYNIIKKISANSIFVVVGDPDQNIYTWRNADARLIMNFDKEYENSKIILLEQNYRSTQTILNAANELIKNNNERIDKNLFTKKEKGTKIEHYYGFSEDAEAQWVVDKINNLIQKKEKLNDIAILYRSNYLSNSIEKLLIKKKINYVVYGSIHFYQREEIKDIIAYLKLINNGDSVALDRVLNVPNRHIGAVTREKIYSYLNNFGNNTFELLVNRLNQLNISSKAKSELSKFINLILKYQKIIKDNIVEEYLIRYVIVSFLDDIDYQKKWSSFDEQNRLENIKELINDIGVWEKENKNKTLNDFINEISLYTDYETEAKMKNNKVSLMTVHASKGLEFKYVFIFGMSESVFPSPKTLEQEAYNGIEEERRLAYVAITRAMEKLYISFSRGFSSQHKITKEPSRFIKEMGINPQKYISYFGYNESFHNFVKGENIEHNIFGKGIVIAVAEKIIEVAFKDPYGIKKITKNHWAIRKGDQ